MQHQGFEQVFYLFYNSVSGGNRGLQFQKFDQQELLFETNPKHTKVKFFNINEASSRNKGMEQVKQHSQNDIHIVIGGGDGSIMWIVGFLLEHQIDLNRCIIIPLPLGTGNDFANTLGWGTTVPADLIGKNNKVLQSYVEQWLSGAESFFDVWDVDITLKEVLLNQTLMLKWLILFLFVSYEHANYPVFQLQILAQEALLAVFSILQKRYLIKNNFFLIIQIFSDTIDWLLVKFNFLFALAIQNQPNR